MSLKKVMTGVPTEFLAAKGIFQHDTDAVTPCQRECTARLAMTIQLEQEAYMTQHPEIMAMLSIFLSKMAGSMKNKLDVLKEAHSFFLQPVEDMDELIRKQLGIGPEGPYAKEDSANYHFQDVDELLRDLRAIIAREFPSPPWSSRSSSASATMTRSSSFLSVTTSDTTLPTPEPIPTPEPTLSENMFVVVSNTVDKAIYSKVKDADLRYDTAYVELSKAVETAMEVPVIEIREDLYQLFESAYKHFELIIMEKERIAAEIAWDKRMRKKMKRTLRRKDNFKGYVTPPTPKSSISSHESYRHPPPKPCICHPQWHYNRYNKDRFGIYLPTQGPYLGENVTVTPAISLEKLDEENTEGGVTTTTDPSNTGTSERTTPR